MTLSAKRQTFLNRMREGEEFAQHGFKLLLERHDFADFFDSLDEAGFFAPGQNPRPVPMDGGKAYRVPYWSALDYLLALAKKSGADSDEGLARKVLRIVGSVTQAGGPGFSDNYHTTRVFAEILAAVPLGVLERQDLANVELWVGGRFFRGGIGDPMERLVLKLLKSSDERHWQKALPLFRACTTIEWQEDAGVSFKKPVTLLGDFWLLRLLSNTARLAGERLGQDICALFRQRLEETYPPHRAGYSEIYRPAIEDNSQNHSWNGADNCAVQALRDAAAGWLDVAPSPAGAFATALLDEPLPILRRVGIHLLNTHWTTLRGVYIEKLSVILSSEHLHEAFELLKNRFGDMTRPERDATLAFIEQKLKDDDGEEARKRWQRRWLSAIVDTGDAAAVALDEKLKGEGIGLPAHPSFRSYSETRVGPGPSPYSVEELCEFAGKRELGDRLTAFVPSSQDWDQPNVDGLAAALEQAAQRSPFAFAAFLGTQAATNIALAYQDALIQGLTKAWEKNSESNHAPDWEAAWGHILSFFELRLGDPTFLDPSMPPDQAGSVRRWMVGLMADFLAAGSTSDERAFPTHLAERVKKVLQALVLRTRSVEHVPDEPATHFLNSEKGKSLRALTYFTLFMTRREATSTLPRATWMSVRPTYDQESGSPRGSEFDFSTALGLYLPQFNFLDDAWTAATLRRVVSEALLSNARCFVDGLAYVQPSRQVYKLLKDVGLLPFLLTLEPLGRHSREKFLERVGLAYLWDDERIQGPILRSLLAESHIDDLRVLVHALALWVPNAKNADWALKILDFWDACVEVSRGAGDRTRALLSDLSRLSGAIDTIKDREERLLLAVAPYVSEGYNGEEFLGQLLRLLPDNPAQVNRIFAAMLREFEPTFDYEERVLRMLQALRQEGFEAEVMQYADRLRNLPGVQDFYDRM